MKKVVFVISALLWAFTSTANMASPIREGTRTGSPFLSSHASVLKEIIRIKPAADFKTAFFQIDYQIYLDKGNSQVPMLFYAIDYKDGYTITIDGEAIELKRVPENISLLEGSSFSDFSKIFESSEYSDELGVEIRESENQSFVLLLKDLKYFEANLDSGNHNILISYTAVAWEDYGPWIKDQDFRYLLAPATFWKSFGTLELYFDGSLLSDSLISNVSNEVQTLSDKVQHLVFDYLPADYLSVRQYLKPSAKATFLLGIGPWGIALILSIPLLLIHLLFLWRTKVNNQKSAYRILLFLGGAIVPLLFIAAYLFSFEIIDSSLGKLASGRHPYVFLSLGLWPFLTLGYVLFCWIIGRFLKRVKH